MDQYGLSREEDYPSLDEESGRGKSSSGRDQKRRVKTPSDNHRGKSMVGIFKEEVGPL